MSEAACLSFSPAVLLSSPLAKAAAQLEQLTASELHLAKFRGLNNENTLMKNITSIKTTHYFECMTIKLMVHRKLKTYTEIFIFAN